MHKYVSLSVEDKLRKFVSDPRVWIKLGNGLMVDPQTLELLTLIRKNQSISHAAKAMSLSFRHAWNLIDKLEKQLGTKVLVRSRGGKGGGLVTLSKKGSEIVKEYNRASKGLSGIVKEEGFWEALGLKISARNKIVGKVTNIKKDAVVAHIAIKSSTPVQIISVITTDAADDLELKVGDKVTAIVKATEVLIAK